MARCLLKEGTTLKTCLELDRGLFYFQGTNWMISKDPELSTGMMVSQNMEFLYPKNVCCTDATLPGPFLVLAPKYGWLADPSLKIECEVFKDHSNTRLLQFLNS